MSPHSRYTRSAWRDLAESFTFLLVAIVSVSVDEYALLRGMYLGPITKVTAILAAGFILGSTGFLSKVIVMVTRLAFRGVRSSTRSQLQGSISE